MSEVPSAFFLTLGTYILLKRNPLPAGTLLFFAGMLRMVLAPVTVLVAMLCLLVRDRRKDALVLIAVFACGCTAEYALEVVGIVQGPSNIDLNLLLAITDMNAPDTQLSLNGFSDEEKAHPRSTYLNFAVAHTRDFIARRLSALYDLWGPWPGEGAMDSPRSILARLVIGLRFPLLLLALVGLWSRRNSLESWIIATPLLVVTMIHVAFYSGQPRYT